MDYDYFVINDDRVFLFEHKTATPIQVLDIKEILKKDGYKQRGEA